jgi:hypothetical protein
VEVVRRSSTRTYMEVVGRVSIVTAGTYLEAVIYKK